MHWPVLKFTAEQAKNVNLMAIKNRLALLESFRLNQKLFLDQKGLQDQAEWWTESGEIKIKSQLTIIPGMPNHSTKLDSAITIIIPFKKLTEHLKLNEQERKAFKLLLANRLNGDTVTISCKRFPFQSQNKKWIFDRLQSTINYVRENSNDEMFKKIPEDLFSTSITKNNKFTFENVMGVSSKEYLNKIKD